LRTSSGLETGNRRFASYVLESGKIRFVLSAAYNPSDEMAAHHLLHGDGVKIIALEVDDVEAAFRETRLRGAAAAWEPREEADDFGVLRTAAIQTYGEVLHVFVDRGDYRDRADLARQLGFPRARISQLLDLLMLAPDLQEFVLDLEAVDGREPLTERALRAVVKIERWGKQRTAFPRPQPANPPDTIHSQV